MAIGAGQCRRILAGFSCVLLPRRRRKRTLQFPLKMPKSHNPLSAYSPSEVPAPQLTNSPLLTQLIRDGQAVPIAQRRNPAGLWRITWTWRLPATICPLPLPIFCGPKLCGTFRGGEHRRGRELRRRSGRLRGWSSGRAQEADWGGRALARCFG